MMKKLASRGLRALLVIATLMILLTGGWSALADAVLTRPASPPAGDPGRFARVDGVRTYYRVSGRGPALVMLHGLGSSHLTWSAVERTFAERFTVYTVDLPGFGYSDKPAVYTSARQEAEFVEHLLDSLTIERATVIGHSLGADVALWLATEHPRRVERLVVVDAAEIGEAAAVFQLAAAPIIGDIMLKATTTPPTLSMMMADAYVQKRVLTPDISDQYARIYWSPGARQAIVELSRSYDADRAALLAAAGGVTAPTLIVWTDRDPYFPVGLAERLHELLPNSEVRIIHDAGHLPQEEQPAFFEDAVLSWF